MPNDRFVYWDACCFLSYMNDEPDRADTLDDLLADSKDRRSPLKIVTSAISMVEVAYAASEKDDQLASTALDDIDALWQDTQAVSLIEFYPEIGRAARDLIRQAMFRGWSLQAADSIHLATAQEIGAIEFHTYDGRLIKYGPLIGMTVGEPTTMNARRVHRPSPPAAIPAPGQPAQSPPQVAHEQPDP